MRTGYGRQPVGARPSACSAAWPTGRRAPGSRPPPADKRRCSATGQTRLVDDLRTGRVARVLRQRLRMRQQDLAREAVCSQDQISLLERGRIDRMSLWRLRRIFRALGCGCCRLRAVAWRDRSTTCSTRARIPCREHHRASSRGGLVSPARGVLFGFRRARVHRPAGMARVVTHPARDRAQDRAQRDIPSLVLARERSGEAVVVRPARLDGRHPLLDRYERCSCSAADTTNRRRSGGSIADSFQLVLVSGEFLPGPRRTRSGVRCQDPRGMRNRWARPGCAESATLDANRDAIPADVACACGRAATPRRRSTRGQGDDAPARRERGRGRSASG